MKKIREASLEIYGGCNYSCPSCPQSIGREKEFKQFMDLNLFKKIVADLKLHGCKSISLQGSGEALINPDIGKYINFLTQNNISSHIITNGSLLNERCIKEIVDSGISSIRISILGSNQTDYTKNMGTKVTLSLILSNISILQRYIQSSRSTCNLILSHLILQNGQSIEEQVENYKNLSLHLEPIGIEIWFPHNWAGSTPGSLNLLNRSNPLARIRSCGRPQSEYLTVRAGGNDGRKAAVVPCCFTLGRDSESVLGYLDTSSIQEVLNSQPYEDLIKAHQSLDFNNHNYCKDCDQLYECPEALVWTNINSRACGSSHTSILEVEPINFSQYNYEE